MEAQLQNLIDKIKQDGVKEAQKAADEILQQARVQSDEIIKKANQEKDAIIKEAQKAAQHIQQSAEAAIKQSGRDTVLSLKEQIIALFDKITKDNISQQLSSANLKQILISIITNFKKDGSLEIEVLLNEKDKADLEGALLAEFSAEIKKGVTFKTFSGADKGFKITEKGKNFYYDFTEEAIWEAFKKYLNPKLANLLDQNKADAK